MPNDMKFGYHPSARNVGAAPPERRKNRRHEVRWPVTLVFDPRMARPDTQSSTYDVSPCGASIISLRDDLEGEVVGILLRPKLGDPKARPVLFSVLARVVAAAVVATPGRRIYRYGLSFVRPLDEIASLAVACAPFEECATSASPAPAALQ